MARLGDASAPRAVSLIAIHQHGIPDAFPSEVIAEAGRETIAEVGATSVKDMGRTMAELKDNYAGRMDFAKASALARKALAGNG